MIEDDTPRRLAAAPMLALAIATPAHTRHLAKLIALLIAARTEEEHRFASARLLRFFAMWARPDTAIEAQASGRHHGTPIWGSPAVALETLVQLVERAPRPGPGRKPPRDQQAVLDAAYLEAATDFAAAVSALAKGQKITPAAARARLKRAERLTGIRRPRRRPFRG